MFLFLLWVLSFACSVALAKRASTELQFEPRATHFWRAQTRGSQFCLLNQKSAEFELFSLFCISKFLFAQIKEIKQAKKTGNLRNLRVEFFDDENWQKFDFCSLYFFLLFFSFLLLSFLFVGVWNEAKFADRKRRNCVANVIYSNSKVRRENSNNEEPNFIHLSLRLFLFSLCIFRTFSCLVGAKFTQNCKLAVLRLQLRKLGRNCAKSTHFRKKSAQKAKKVSCKIEKWTRAELACSSQFIFIAQIWRSQVRLLCACFVAAFEYFVRRSSPIAASNANSPNKQASEQTQN